MTYRCGIILISKETGSVLIVKENDRFLPNTKIKSPDSGKWGLPKGQMEAKDRNNKFACARRELFEETGIWLVDIKDAPAIKYRNTYLFIVETNDECKNFNLQDKEISEAKWVKFEDLCDKFCKENEKSINNSLKLVLRNRKRITDEISLGNAAPNNKLSPHILHSRLSQKV